MHDNGVYADAIDIDSNVEELEDSAGAIDIDSNVEELEDSDLEHDENANTTSIEMTFNPGL